MSTAKNIAKGVGFVSLVVLLIWFNEWWFKDNAAWRIMLYPVALAGLFTIFVALGYVLIMLGIWICAITAPY